MTVAIIMILIVCPVSLVAMIIIAAGKKNKDDTMNIENSIRNVYLYTILIIALIAIIACSIGALRIGLDIILPEKTVGGYTASEQVSRNDSLISFFTNISIVAMAVPLFIKHNKLANDLKNK